MSLLDVLARVEAESPDAAAELLRLATYEALCDEADRVGPAFEADVLELMSKRTDDARRALVRSYVAKRVDGESTAGYLPQAARLAALDAVVLKAEGGVTEDDPDTPWWDRRIKGKFAPGKGRANVGSAMDFAVNREGSARGQAERVGQNWREGGRYERLQTLGNALTAAGSATNRPELNAVGTGMRILGEVGPEAERVLGPGMRRTAYRYRGTERRPDQQTQLAARYVANVARRAAEDPKAAQGAEARFTPRANNADSAVGYLLSTERGRKMTPDQLRLAATGDFGALELADQVPNFEQARISLAAGKLPPSLGMMFDSDGDMVSEAMGYNGDHYLPFDLKNLKRLQGGSYVRTRTTGGLTDEDIYTGLLTGARQMQVISNSGVFLLEFDPSVRGGRRYSDKARQMVERYAALTQAIGSGNLFARDLTGRQKAELREQALTQAGGDEQDAREVYTRLEAKERAKQSFHAMTDEEIDDEATRRATQELGRSNSRQQLAERVRQIGNEIREEQRGQAVRAYRLDGHGYNVALEALRQEFPYFIRRVRHEDLEPFLERRGQLRPDSPRGRRGVSDIGYTARGGSAPEKVRNSKPAVQAQQAQQYSQQSQQGAQTGSGTQPGAPKMPLGHIQQRKPWVEPGTRSLAEKVAQDQGGFARQMAAPLVTALRVNKDYAADLWPEAYNNADESIALSYDAGNWANWLAGKGGPEAQARFILGSSDPRHLEQAAALVTKLQGALGEDAPEQPDLAKLATAIGAAAALQEPTGRKVTGDPVLAVPENDRPAEFPEIAELGDRPSNYTRYLANHDDVALAAKAMESAPDTQIARELAKDVDRFTGLAQWAADGYPESTKFSDADRSDARDIVEGGQKSALYRNLAARQKAWTLLRQRRALYGLDAAKPPPLGGGGDAPKAPGVAKRLTYVHPPGSPLAVSLSKALARRR